MLDLQKCLEFFSHCVDPAFLGDSYGCSLVGHYIHDLVFCIHEWHQLLGIKVLTPFLIYEMLGLIVANTVDLPSLQQKDHVQFSKVDLFEVKMVFVI